MLVTVHRYRAYDILIDDYRTSTRMATADKIAKIGGEIIPGTAYPLDTDQLDDGWTGKNYTHILETAAQFKKALDNVDIDEARRFVVANVMKQQDDER